MVVTRYVGMQLKACPELRRELNAFYILDPCSATNGQKLSMRNIRYKMLRIVHKLI